MHPPASVAALDVVVEESADCAPAEVVVKRGRRNRACAAEHEWGVDVSHEATRPLARADVRGDGEKGAEEPVPL